MRKLITILVTVLITASVFLPQQAGAQSPEKMSYQAVIRDSDDVLVTDTQVGMQISILQGSASGTVIYTETQTPTTNANGLLSIEIGGGTGFSTIDWANDIYFIKTETDPAGGTNYSITGTSQLLSVPYALHSKTAESITGTITETDPVYTGSQAANITAGDITNLSNLSGVNTGDQDISGITVNTQAIQDTAAQIRADIPDVSGFLTSETDPVFTAWDKSTGISITESQISDLGAYIETETDPRVPFGITPGEIQYWNGTEWAIVPAGQEGDIMTFINNTPTWVGGEPPFGTITNPTTGKIWMDRNLGASRVATSPTDSLAYGDLYQWGRGTDGHEKRTSATTTTLSSTDNPGHGNFIIVDTIDPFDWRSPQNENLWQGIDGINNPCPEGYRLPTQAEYAAEFLSWSSQDTAGAFASLKLTVAGARIETTGLLASAGWVGAYWSSQIFYYYSTYLSFGGAGIPVMMIGFRARGASVRCIQD